MNKLVAFGDSFTFGSELSDDFDHNIPSTLTWSALLANKLNLNYECKAIPGTCNQTILRALINYLAQQKTNDFAVAIMWSFTSRYEYHSLTDKDWKQVSWAMIDNDIDVKVFYNLLGNNEINELYTSYICFLTAQNILKEKSIPYVFTIADTNPLKRYFSLNNLDLKSLISLIDWDKWVWTNPDVGFFDWGKKNFKVGKHLHPLDDAHVAFADEIFPKVKNLISFTN